MPFQLVTWPNVIVTMVGLSKSHAKLRWHKGCNSTLHARWVGTKVAMVDWWGPPLGKLRGQAGRVLARAAARIRDDGAAERLS